MLISVRDRGGAIHNITSTLNVNPIIATEAEKYSSRI